MKNTKNILWALPLFSVLLFTSCEKDDPKVPNEEELITTLIYTLTPQGGGTAVEFRFEDLDGDGGNAPVVTNGVLAANTTYSGVIILANDIENPSVIISEEVEEEAEEHQFFYRFSTFFLSGGFEYADSDANGNPIGLLTTFETPDSQSGLTLTITLRHEPDKTASGVALGLIDHAGGETDIEVTFDVTVQ